MTSVGEASGLTGSVGLGLGGNRRASSRSASMEASAELPPRSSAISKLKQQQQQQQHLKKKKMQQQTLSYGCFCKRVLNAKPKKEEAMFIYITVWSPPVYPMSPIMNESMNQLQNG